MKHSKILSTGKKIIIGSVLTMSVIGFSGCTYKSASSNPYGASPCGASPCGAPAPMQIYQVPCHACGR